MCAPAGSVASRWWNVASPDCSPIHDVISPAASPPMSTPAMATGPCLRTTSQYPSRPEITPPTRQITQYHPSAAMNALVSELTRSAAP